jgi:murein DD-endopeptidase MepM/ murein hydrolase activator NlpD
MRARLLLAAGAVAVACGWAFPDHAPVASTGGFGESTCSGCHFDNPANDADGVFRIEGFPERFEPGTEYPLTVRLRRAGMELGGFQLSARWADGGQAGDLVGGMGVAVRTHAGVAYAGHSGAATASAEGEVVWRAGWRAPPGSGTIVVHAAANVGNGDGSPLGDHVYTLVLRTGR